MLGLIICDNSGVGCLAFAALGLNGCELGSSPAPKVPRGTDGRTCAERLVGYWRFVGIAPDVPQPAAQAAQLQSLQSSIRLTFDGRMATTTGAGVQSGNPYSVDSDDGTTCRIVSPDTTGATQREARSFQRSQPYGSSRQAERHARARQLGADAVSGAELEGAAGWLREQLPVMERDIAELVEQNSANGEFIHVLRRR